MEDPSAADLRDLEGEATDEGGEDLVPETIGGAEAFLAALVDFDVRALEASPSELLQVGCSQLAALTITRPAPQKPGWSVPRSDHTESPSPAGKAFREAPKLSIPRTCLPERKPSGWSVLPGGR